MSIGQRLVVIFILIALLPLSVMLGIGISASKNLLEQTEGRNFELVASEKARSIDMIIDAKIHEARELAQHPLVQAYIGKANAVYDRTEPLAISSAIHSIDKKWIEQRSKNTHAQRILHNDLSTLFSKRLKARPKGYGEIFVTDRHGAVVAMTKVLSDYNQSDEQWWQAAYNGGKGGVFIDDRGFDESVQSIVVGVVVPIKRKGHVIGVLKINFCLNDIVEIISGDDLDEGEGVFLARSLGSVIISSRSWINGIVFEQALTHAMNQGRPGWRENRHAGTPTVLGYAPVQSMISARILAPNARPGISGEVWMPVVWFVFVETELNPARASTDKLVLTFLLSGGLALVIVIGIALFTARSLSRPIHALQKGAEEIAQGNLALRVGTDAKDEIGQLSRSFDKMLDRINALTASRDELNHEIFVRKLAEQALDAARTEAEAANQAKSRFLANVSHDLRTPLNAIIGFSEMMRDQTFGPLGNERYREYADDISSSGHFLIKVINDILDLSKIEAGKYELEEKHVDLSSLILSSIKLMEQQAQQAKVTITADINANLPLLQGDDRALSQILHNLISNAIKFTPENGHVTVSAATNNSNCVVLGIKDTGIGMTRAEINQALEPFVQANSHVSRPHEGTGLGLSLCKNFVEMHGGIFTIDSTKGVGTTATIVFPAERTVPAN